MPKNIDTADRLTKAFPELPMEALMKEHNIQEQWNKIVGEIDTFVEQHAAPAAQPRSRS